MKLPLPPDHIAPDETLAAATTWRATALAALGDTPSDTASDHLRADFVEVWLADLRERPE